MSRRHPVLASCTRKSDYRAEFPRENERGGGERGRTGKRGKERDIERESARARAPENARVCLHMTETERKRERERWREGEIE